MRTSFDVQIWSILPYDGVRGTTYTVRWAVDGMRHRDTFKTSTLAESFRADLLTAARKGEAFVVDTGLPMSASRATSEVKWLDCASAYLDSKWPRAAATYRRSLSEALTAMTPALLDGRVEGKPDEVIARRALHRWAFNTAKRNDPSRPTEVGVALRWLRRHSLPVSRLAESSVLRHVLDTIALKLDGTQAAGSVVAKRRTVLYNVCEYAVEQGHLAFNPLIGFKWTRPKVSVSVDRRLVVNPIQARTLLAAVRQTRRSGSRLVAFFALMYFSGLRPEEAADLGRRNMSLPDEGWGELYLEQAAPYAGSDWTNDGRQRERRQLKNRAVGEGRRVPCPPELTAILHEHIATFGIGDDGRLFRGERTQELPKLTYMRAWRAARSYAFTEEVVESRLAATPYALRHACVSTWLNGGVSAPQVAEWAGHSVEVLLKVYAKCLDGQDETSKCRIMQALGHRRDGPSSS